MNFYKLENITDGVVVLNDHQSKIELRPKSSTKISETVLLMFKKQIHDLQIKKYINISQVLKDTEPTLAAKEIIADEAAKNIVTELTPPTAPEQEPPIDTTPKTKKPKKIETAPQE